MLVQDDNIDWKYNPFDVDSIEGTEGDPEQLLSKITFEGSPQLQAKLKALVMEFIDHAIRDLFFRLKIVLYTLFIDLAKATLT